MRERLLWAGSMIAAVVTLAGGNWISKTLSVSLLGAVALGRGRRLAATALFISSLGDLLLALGGRYFMHGLAAFLAAHIAYTTLFLRARGKVGRPLFTTAVVLYAFALAAYLGPVLGTRLVPLLLYLAAITVMVISAAHSAYPPRLVITGAVLFLISDSLIGISRFRHPVPYRHLLVWGTYYAGQFCLARGILKR